MTSFFTQNPLWSDRLSALAKELQPETIFSSFVAGSITGMIGVIRAISYAALIFSGTLAVHLNVGVGIAIFSSAAISIVVALTSSLPGMIATPLAAPTAVLAILAAQVASSLTAESDSSAVLMTVVAAIALGSLLTGATLWLLGTVRGGNALQFVPYPVVGGFMAGTGWLLVRGAAQVITGEALTFANLAWFFQPEPMLHWGVSLTIAVVLLVMTKRSQHSLIMPSILLAVTLLFYGVVWQSRLPLNTIRAQGWLLGPFPAGNLWQPLAWHDLAQVRWDVIAQSGGTLGLLVFVSLLSLVLTNGGIELALGRNLDLNQELRAIGLANIVAGLASTMAGNQALPSTLLVHKMGADSRLTGLFKALP
ncbi:MAG: SulP family inorganic anion transporter, partial [Phormidesmis sp.]